MSKRESRDIQLHAHCRRCMPEKPVNQTPSEWSRLDAGLTKTGFQVWCKRCGLEIAHFTPDALKDLIERSPWAEPCDCERCRLRLPHGVN